MKSKSLARSFSYETRPKILNHAQRVFGVYHPVKEFHRFSPVKKADSGIDPNGGFIGFMKKDLIRPINRPSIVINMNKEEPMFNNNWAIGTTKRCNKSEWLPKLDTYKDYKFSSPPKEEVVKYQKSFLPSDCISVKVPQTDKIYGPDSFLNRKARYGSHSESKEGWCPRHYESSSTTNRSNVDYNIINFKVNPNFSNSDILDKTYNHIKKGVAEFDDYRNPYFPNYNKYFGNLVETDKNIFKSYKGIFSNYYDSALKNGSIYMPFRKEKDVIDAKPKKNYN